MLDLQLIQTLKKYLFFFCQKWLLSHAVCLTNNNRNHKLQELKTLSIIPLIRFVDAT